MDFSPEDAAIKEIVNKITSPGVESDTTLEKHFRECNHAIMAKRFVVLPDSALDEYLKDLLAQSEEIGKEIDKTVNELIA